jgi:hypothetical protein
LIFFPFFSGYSEVTVNFPNTTPEMLEIENLQDLKQTMSVFAGTAEENISFTITDGEGDSADVNYRVEGDYRIEFAEDFFLMTYGEYLRGINPTMYGYLYGTGGEQSNRHLYFVLSTFN